MVRDLEEVQDDLERWALQPISRVPTGFSFFDDRTGGGVATGEMLLFLARSGVGKTWVGLNMLAANPWTPAIFFSLEMHGRYALKRLAGIHTGTPTADIEAGLKKDGTHSALTETRETFSMLAIDDRPGLSWREMLDSCDQYERQFGQKPQVIVVDYLELVSTFGASGKSEKVDVLATTAKDFAREADVALVLLHQVNRGERVKKEDGTWRADEGDRPLSMTSGRYGGETAADYVLGAYRPGLDPDLPEQSREWMQNDFRLQFLKTRGDHGIHPSGKQHHFDEPSGRISELTERNY